MSYWQIAAGDGERDYSEVFIKYGVMLVGPGDFGNYFENEDEYRNWNFIRRFATEIKKGDTVVLKRPVGNNLYKILAIGKITSESEEGMVYKYIPAFSDVEGWDLQHCIKVNWTVPLIDESISGLIWGTLSNINNKEVIEKVNELFETGTATKPAQVPDEPKKLTDEELIEELIDYGLRPKDAEEFSNTILRIRRLAKWYYRNGKDVLEHETRTFLIIPLLLALGWPEQKMKIEWKKIDIAFFEKPYTQSSSNDDQLCIAILESKRLGAGLSYAEKQVEGYAKSLAGCKTMIVSDGCRYKLFENNNNKWSATAYLNILSPTREHSLNKEIKGAIEVFRSLMYK